MFVEFNSAIANVPADTNDDTGLNQSQLLARRMPEKLKL
jgi:uncharacterized surface protein with fasciclin (FAS1) repeats